MENSQSKYSYFVIFLETKNFSYTEAFHKIKRIHDKIKLSCQEFTSHNDEFVVIKTNLELKKLEEILKIENCRVQFVGDKTNLGIKIPGSN